MKQMKQQSHLQRTSFLIVMVRYTGIKKKINFLEPSKLLACMYTPSAPYADRQSSATVLEPSSDNAEAKIAGHLMCSCTNFTCKILQLQIDLSARILLKTTWIKLLLVN